VTPTQTDLLDRAYAILENLDTLTMIRELTDNEYVFRLFLEDLVEELESA